MTPTSDVRLQQHDGLGHITLNRPEDLNALSHAMVTSMRVTLWRWREDPTVRTVVIDGAGDRGLSAGEDVDALYEDVRSGGQRTVAFWADEYRLALEIADYPKPVVALMDGTVMGGAVGISAHASHRVVNQDSVVALPELAIALVPHVGGTRLLSRAPGELGTHLALTADRMDAADAMYCGFAHHWVPLEDRAALFEALADTTAEIALSRVAVDPPYQSELRAQRPWIDHCYSTHRIEDIIDRLRSLHRGDARAAAERIAGFSPTASKVVLRALREARSDGDLESCLRREFRLATRAVVGHDAVAAMRARLTFRGGLVGWEPESLQQVTDADVDAFFDSSDDQDLDLHQVPRPVTSPGCEL
jgi:enoyl-CoA hydratase